MADTQKIELTREQAAFLLFLGTCGMEYIGSSKVDPDDDTKIIIERNELSEAMLTTLGSMIPWMIESGSMPSVFIIRAIQEYNSILGPLVNWLDPQPSTDGFPPLTLEK